VKHQTVNVTEFKAKCLSLLDGINERGGSITITKRGRPLAKVVPAPDEAWKSLKGSWVGRVTIADDIADADTADLWEVVREGTRRKR
jgi:prevent-host-death family protein